MTLDEFERMVKPEVDAQEDRSLRYVSSPREHDLALEIAWPFVCRVVTGRFPWELVEARRLREESSQ